MDDAVFFLSQLPESRGTVMELQLEMRKLTVLDEIMMSWVVFNILRSCPSVAIFSIILTSA